MVTSLHKVKKENWGFTDHIIYPKSLTEEVVKNGSFWFYFPPYISVLIFPLCSGRSPVPGVITAQMGHFPSAWIAPRGGSSLPMILPLLVCSGFSFTSLFPLPDLLGWPLSATRSIDVFLLSSSLFSINISSLECLATCMTSPNTCAPLISIFKPGAQIARLRFMYQML